MRLSAAGFAGLLAAAALLTFPAHPQEQNDTAWVDKNYPAAFNDSFPIGNFQGDFIAVRAHRDRPATEQTVPYREFSLAIEHTDDPKAMRGFLWEARGVPLYQQLTALHAKDPSATLDQLKKGVKLQAWVFTTERCLAVADQYKAFENITFVRPRDDDATDEHPVMYQFHESVGGGDSEVMEYVESRAFPKWANATHKAFAACAAAAK